MTDDTDLCKWSTDACDKVYVDCLKGNSLRLRGHNILKEGEKEILISLNLASLYFGVRHVKGKVLDVGCGCGYMTDCFSSMGFDAIGFDLSKNGIALAKERYSKIDFFVGDATIPQEYFNNEVFNIIHMRWFPPFCFSSDFDDQIKVIEGYLKILKPNGIMIIARPEHGGERQGKILDYRQVREYCKQLNLSTVGPLFYSQFKHLNVYPTNKFTTRSLQLLARTVSATLRSNWMEWFLIYKNAPGL
jgi:SAM-dependent methyltransferase